MYITMKRRLTLIFASLLLAMGVAWAQTEYVVSGSTGTFNKTGFAAQWTYTTGDATLADLTLREKDNKNNMKGEGSNMMLFSGTSRTSTYVLAVSYPYQIVGYSFTCVDADNTHDKTITIGGEVTNVTTEPQTIEKSIAATQSTEFTLAGANEQVTFTNFKVTIEKAPVVTLTYEYAYNGAKKTEVKYAAIGESYPAPTLPYGMTTTTVLEGEVKAEDDGKTFTFECAASNVPFEFADSYANITKWYYIQMHSNNKKYIEYIANGNYLEWADASLPEGLAKEYAWAFVGNPFDGFKLYNKRAGKEVSVKSTGSGNPSMAADGSTFILAASSQTGNSGYFCLQYPNGQYLNAQNGKVAHWSANDAGSTILVSEYIEVPHSVLTVEAFAKVGAVATWNGETKTVPAVWEVIHGTTITNATLTVEGNSNYTLTGLYEGETALGTSVEIASLETDRTITAKFSPSFFSSTYGEKWVRLNNCSDKNYWATIEGANGKTAILDYADEKQLWCLVGTAESFVLYNKAAGNQKALKVTAATYGDGSAATLENDTEATWKLIEQDFGFALVPTHNANNSNLGINMYAGAGGYLKLYYTDAGNTGSYWVVEMADLSKPLTLNVEVDEIWESSPRVAELTFTVNGKASTTRILGNVEGQALYLPAGAAYEVSSMTYRGYTYNGCTENNGTLTASYTANDERTLYYSPRDGKPYRIPAIATAANGDVFAICDYRPCGNDIGYGEVDLVCRVSSDNGVTWTEERTIADGHGYGIASNDTSKIWQVGFGDPAIVADRDRNEILVMSVCGNRTCWDGNFGDPNPNPNRVSRLYITYDEEKKEWIYGEPQEVTYDIYRLFENKNGGEAYIASMFIGAGKICQSRVVKKGDYYRLYCSVWAVTKSIRTHHNYVIYSDDFGKTWNVLGELGKDANPSQPGPAFGGNEPKCEELPDGTVVLSSRKNYGRYFNLFTFSDDTYTTGSWGTCVSSNDVEGGLSFGGNSTNGEIYKVTAVRKSDNKVCDLMFQSIPTGNDRSNVAIFYKEMEYTEEGKNKYTPETFAKDWTKGKHVSTKGSCYSTMILQADGRIAFFFEEEPSGYCMVYIPYTIEELTGGAYSLYVDEKEDEKEEDKDEDAGVEFSTLSPQPSTVIYDLQGRCVMNATKGVYIVDGHKEFIR